MTLIAWLNWLKRRFSRESLSVPLWPAQSPEGTSTVFEVGRAGHRRRIVPDRLSKGRVLCWLREGRWYEVLVVRWRLRKGWRSVAWLTRLKRWLFPEYDLVPLVLAETSPPSSVARLIQPGGGLASRLGPAEFEPVHPEPLSSSQVVYWLREGQCYQVVDAKTGRGYHLLVSDGRLVELPDVPLAGFLRGRRDIGFGHGTSLVRGQ